MLTKKIVTLISPLLFIFLSFGCASESNFGEDAQIIVYSGRSESLVGPLIEQFRETSGREVLVKYGGTGPLIATLQEEGDASPADLFFAQDPGGLGAIESMLAALPQDLTSGLPDWAVSENDKWVGVSGRQRVVVFNTEKNLDLPSSIWDFVNPEWRGRIGWAPSNGSFQSMVTGMRSLWGEERTLEWLQGIMNNDPQVYPSNTPIVAAAASGEIDVGFVNHYYLHRFIAEEGEGFTARNHYLVEDDPGGIILVAGVGVLQSSDNSEGALEFVRFLLSDEAQRYFAEQTFEFPVSDVVSSSRAVPLPEVRPCNLGFA